jgi:GxxExxY protein
MDRAESVHRTGTIVDAAMKVHSALGPGLLESAYQACLAHELRQRGLQVRTQVVLPLTYGEVVLNEAYRIDLMIDEEVVVAVKAVEALLPVHRFQLLTYLRLSGRRVGLLFNFNEARLRDGIKRMVNDW